MATSAQPQEYVDPELPVGMDLFNPTKHGGLLDQTQTRVYAHEIQKDVRKTNEVD